MKKLIASVVFLAACHSSSTMTPSSAPQPAPVIRGNQTGAPDPLSAVNVFFDAVKKQDLQQMGAVWGGPDGPARDLMSETELFQREQIIICHVKNDRYDIIGDAPSPSGGRDIAININYKNVTRATTANVVQGPAGRWYVRSIDTSKLGEICQKR